MRGEGAREERGARDGKTLAFKVKVIFTRKEVCDIHEIYHGTKMRCIQTSVSKERQFSLVRNFSPPVIALSTTASRKVLCQNRSQPPPGGGGTPLYKLYRYVAPQRVWFLGRFGLKTGIDFDNYGLKSGLVFKDTTTAAQYGERIG